MNCLRKTFSIVLLIVASQILFAQQILKVSGVVTASDDTYPFMGVNVFVADTTGAGTWPSFFTLGSSISSARWPLCGEIDIMEHIGSQRTMISHATDTSKINGSKGNNWYNRQTRADMEGNFHTYDMEW